MSRPSKRLPRAKAVEKAIARIVQDEDKVYDIMQVLETNDYESPTQQLHNDWSTQQRSTRPEEVEGSCTGACRTGLCCCVSCGSCSFFCTVALCVLFFAFYHTAKYIVYLYKTE